MKILVFGAKGRTGREFVNAVNSRHSLKLFDGDVMDTDAVNEAVRDVDAIVSLIGHVKGSHPWVQTEGIKNMVQAMHTSGVSRIVSLTGSGVRLSGDRITLMDRILNIAVQMIDPARVRDGIRHADILMNSSLEYTIVRVLKLTNGPLSQRKALTLHGPVTTFVSRKDVAKLLLEVLEDPKYIRTSPLIGNL